MSPDNTPAFRVRTFSWANLAKYLRYCRTYGLQNATWLAFRKIFRGSRLPTLVESLHVPQLPLEVADRAPKIEKKISVIIPTRDAGNEFSLLLRKLRSQKGIDQIEIIVVDSGSVDRTVNLASAAGAEVIQIPPESFTHSFSRNKGAERATGDYLLFIVQDALPLTDRWLWEMARTLETTDVVGVSCAEYPRADCDLFYQLLLWNHYRSMQLDRDRILQWDSSCTSTAGLRANAQLSGISFLIRRDIFEKYRYAGNYGEDLELGIRLIRDRHKVGFLYGTRVLHSHNRPAYYFLKRGYVDVRNLARVLPELTFPEMCDKERVFRDIVALYQRLKSISGCLLQVPLPAPVPKFMDRLRAAVQARGVSSSDGQLDSALDEFIERLHGAAAVSYDPGKNMIVPHLLQHLNLLQEFLAGVYPRIDESLMSEIQLCIFKIFALHSGTHLGYLYLAQSAVSAGDPTLADLDGELVLGV